MAKPTRSKPDPRAAATHDIINTIDLWLAAGVVGRKFIDDGLVCPLVGGWHHDARDGGFNDHMRTMLQHVPWHAYEAGTLRALLLLILDGMPDGALAETRRLAAAEMEIAVAKMDEQEQIGGAA